MVNFWDEKFDDGIKNDLMDCAYCFNRFHPDREDFRNWINDIYQNFIKYCPEDEKKFLEESRKNGKFNSRLWEIYTFYVLNKTGYIFEKTNKEGPDILIKHDNINIWIECVASQSGNNENKIKDSPIGTVYIPQTDEDYLLRISESFNSKAEKISKYKERGIILENDLVVIAINTGSLNKDIQTKEFANGFPLIVNACFGIGDLTYSIPIEDQDQPISRCYQKKDQIFKKNGTPINIDYFNSNKYNIISGVLYTNKSVFDSFYNNIMPITKCSYSEKSKNILLLFAYFFKTVQKYLRINMSEQKSFKKSISHISVIHNPYATNKLSTKVFKDFKHYFIENDILKTRLNEEIKSLISFKMP
ncbi:hypothetical protein GCL60_02660 [Silvanigrella paludirubra]|uniref:Uncharacterized protein n=1 Tax=Silvanigrella paludirubra TaxID=2499159 RepID=A0A6N6VYH7_9BACT|nr:hypothetical protein [Silvanigrella paludirubra]KAB8040847.1 hypothetical protein GCL60_02660 [Silvanigrella paludirubra]